MLCLTWKAFKDCGVSDNTLSSASDRGTQSWGMIDHPEKRRTKVIVWAKLGDRYRELIIKNIGDPLEYFSKQPIRELIIPDPRAEEYYRKKLISMKSSNLHEKVSKYTKAVSYINFLIKAENDKKWIKQVLNISFKQLKENVCSIIVSDNIALPKENRPLENKIKKFKEIGYDCILRREGNLNAKKIGKTAVGFDEELCEKQIALIRKCASMHNNFDSQQITNAVNKVFAANEWPVISKSTVYTIIKANEHLTKAGNRGKRAYNNEISMQVKRHRPKFPLQYFTLDGWTVELAYLDENGKPSRLVVVVVLDVMNNYPIGYAIGERESADLIRAANRNALIHTNELFGDYYRPWQLQSDNFAIKQNTPFFEAIAHLHTPAAVGNAKAKVIEPYFKDLNKNYCQRAYNWTGFNIDAQKRNQVNREFSDKIKKNFPNKDELISQIDSIFFQERSLKHESYIMQFNAMPASEKVTLERKDWLMVFGKPTGYTNALHGPGIITTLKGTKLVYDSFDPAFRNLQHLNWKVVYDEHDLETILAISEDDKHRFVLDQKRSLPMDVRSMTSEDHTYLAQVRKYNKEREQHVIDTYIEDAALVEDVLSNTVEIDANAELAIKGMFTYNGQQKEGIQDAKGLKKQKEKQLKIEQKESAKENANWQAAHMEYLKSKTDFSKYLD